MSQFVELLELLIQEKQRRISNYHWKSVARENQLPPRGDWFTWLIMAGRGFGKTRTGAETIYQWVRSGMYKHIALIGKSQFESQAIMLKGESGILSIQDPAFKATYLKSESLIIWPNGAKAYLLGGDYYEKLRGFQFDCAWVDELAKFRNPHLLWQQLLFCLRLGTNPRCVVTTTPRPCSFLKKLCDDTTTHITRGSSFENAANLPPTFIKKLTSSFKGTQLGQQEIEGILLEDKTDALWRRSYFRYGVCDLKTISRCIVALDPAVTSSQSSDETGIIVAAKDIHGNGWVLEDASMRAPVKKWVEKVVSLFDIYPIDRVVVETNQGGDLLETMLRSCDNHIPLKKVHALQNKMQRAEPVANLYERGKIFHIKGLQKLEDQLCYYTGVGKSPDRLDALVWALNELFFKKSINKVMIWEN